MARPFTPSPFLFGIEGTRATRGTVELLRETSAAGILLLGRNIASPAQTRALIEELVQRLGRRLLVSVDHEGGWVLRFASGLTAFPGNGALGKAGDPKLAAAVGARMGRELRSLGIGLNLAPVVDVNTERYNPGIGIRSFGKDPALVGEFGAAFIRGMQKAGAAACAKHFPGKGAADVDAHVTLPTINLSRSEHGRGHLPPFAAAIRAGVECVMTSHAVFPAWDASKTPATFSRKITHGLLRKRLGFKGVVISDDLCMGAVTESRTVPEAAVECLEAGHDLLIVAHAASLQRESFEAVREALESGRIPSPERRALEGRLAGLLKRRAGPPRGGLPKPDSALPLKIARAAVEVAQIGSTPLPLPLGGNGPRRVAVFWPDFREVRDRFTFEGGPEAPLARLRRRLARWPARIEFVKTPVSSTGAGAKVLAAARRADLSLLFCFEALRFPGQKEALEALQSHAPGRLVACLLRSPWDKSLLKPSVTALHAHGYRDSQVEALVEALR